MDAERGELLINNEPLFKLGDLTAGIRRNFEQHGTRLHIVDYLQLAWTGNAESQVARITEVSHAVRQLAQELLITTFCLSQLNRETTKQRSERPQKEGMAGAAALENDSNLVLLLDHSRRTPIHNSAGQPRGWVSWLLLDENRHGPGGEIPIRFDADTGRMRQRLSDEILPGEVQP
jgi:replicative DNA helicase